MGRGAASCAAANSLCGQRQTCTRRLSSCKSKLLSQEVQAFLTRYVFLLPTKCAPAPAPTSQSTKALYTEKGPPTLLPPACTARLVSSLCRRCWSTAWAYSRRPARSEALAGRPPETRLLLALPAWRNDSRMGLQWDTPARSDSRESLPPAAGRGLAAAGAAAVPSATAARRPAAAP